MLSEEIVEDIIVEGRINGDLRRVGDTSISEEGLPVE